MNFLLHHHFAANETTDTPRPDLVAIGAMLPDLFRMASGGRRKERPVAAPTAEVSEEVRALALGCEHHATIDRWFHACEPFATGERDLRRAFLLPDSTKLVLFAHAAWEMCLDGAWLRRADASEIATVKQASKVAPFVWEVAVRQGFAPVSDEAARFHFESRMRRILDAFADGTIYADYLSAGGIARRVAGIRGAFGLGLPSASSLSAWTRALEPFVERSDSALLELFEARRENQRSNEEVGD